MGAPLSLCSHSGKLKEPTTTSEWIPACPTHRQLLRYQCSSVVNYIYIKPYFIIFSIGAVNFIIRTLYMLIWCFIWALLSILLSTEERKSFLRWYSHRIFASSCLKSPWMLVVQVPSYSLGHIIKVSYPIQLWDVKVKHFLVFTTEFFLKFFGLIILEQPLIEDKWC